MFFVDLRRLILLLATASSLLTMGYTLYGAYSAERTLLIEQALETAKPWMNGPLTPVVMIFSFAFIGFICSLIMAAIMKKNPPVFE